jgi:polar amino acid transport system substrate-binding protein
MKARAFLVAAGLVATLAACTNASQDIGTPTLPSSAPASSEASGGVSAKAAELLPPNVQGKTLHFATDASYPPFEQFDSGNQNIVGFDVDVMRAIGSKLGVTFEPVNAGFDSILTGLAAGRYDAAASSFSVTPEREKVVDFVTYLQGGAGIAAPKGNPQQLRMDWQTLCGHTIAAQKGTTQAIEELPGLSKKCTDAGKPAITISLFPSQNDTILAIASGRVDAMMGDSTAISYQAKLSGGRFELAPGDVYEARPTGIALQKSSPLKPAVAEAVKELYADGTIAKIAEQWSVPASNFAPHPGA